MATKTKAQLEKENTELRTTLDKLDKKISKVVKNVETTGKIAQGTDWEHICKVGKFSISFMPQSDDYAVPAIWIGKGKKGLPIEATNKDLETLESIIIEIREKAELTA